MDPDDLFLDATKEFDLYLGSIPSQ